MVGGYIRSERQEVKSKNKKRKAKLRLKSG